MSSMTFGQRRFNVKPPDKGSFPLDHEGECKEFMVKYMECLNKNKSNNADCREQSRDYLQCRMNNNLMAKENWKKLGYADLENEKADTTSS